VNVETTTNNPGEKFFIYSIDKKDIIDYRQAELVLIQNVKIYVDYKDIYNNIYTVFYKYSGKNPYPIELDPEFRLVAPK
jgi:hypothetical protein